VFASFGNLANSMESWILALGGSPWVYPALTAFAIVDGFFPPIPSESAVIALAAAATSGGGPNLSLVILFAAVGAWCGDQIAYQIGSMVNVRTLRIMRGDRAQKTLDWAEHALEHRGPVFIIAARYVPIGRVAVNMTAGGVHYPRRLFMLLAAIAATTWAIYSAVIGVAAGIVLHDQPMLAIVVGVVGGLLIGTLIQKVMSVRSRRKVAAMIASED
jgi:membrane-associated protein